MLLILTNSEDQTADYLVAKLTSSQIRFVRVDSDLIVDRVKVSYDGTAELNVGDQRICSSEVSNVWFRRPKPPSVPLCDDDRERQHVRDEWSHALEGILAHIPMSRWVNHPVNNFLGSHKLEQLTRAHAFGFNVPPTIVTLDTRRAAAFARFCKNKLIVKPLSGGYIERDDPQHDTAIYTNAISIDDITSFSGLSQCPTLLQGRIDKELDVRVVVVDDYVTFVGLQNSRNQSVPHVDIRHDNMRNVEYSIVSPPRNIATDILRFVRSYSLRFSAIDMAIDRGGRWWFLENNPNGQWGWLDLVGATNIANAFITSFGATAHVHE